MRRWAVGLNLLAILSCERSNASSAREADSLLAKLADTAAVDTAAARREHEFDKCLYVYDTEERIRECLVMQHRWPPQDAARTIAVYKGRTRRTLDSLERVRDSLYREESADVARRQAEARRARDSAYLATHQERLDGEPVGYASDALPWVVDRRTGAYYRTDCQAATRVPVEVRVFHGYQDEVKAAGHWPSRQVGCS